MKKKHMDISFRPRLVFLLFLVLSGLPLPLHFQTTEYVMWIWNMFMGILKRQLEGF